MVVACNSIPVPVCREEGFLCEIFGSTAISDQGAGHGHHPRILLPVEGIE
jgi:hypothetical protein